MNEQMKNVSSKEETPKLIEGQTAVKPSSWKKLLAKKWVFPATYMAAAAIILTLMWVYQGAGNQSLTDEEVGLALTNQGVTDVTLKQPDAVAVNANTETMQWPVVNRNEVEVIMPFFDSKANNEVRQSALIQYGETFIPNVGIGLARQDNQPFDVLAAMSGKVSLVEKNPLVGNQVVITHENGLMTIYQSLAEVNVQQGAEVRRGDIIAKAGRNELEKHLGYHLHFEIREGQDGAPLNPEQFLNQTGNK